MPKGSAGLAFRGLSSSDESSSEDEGIRGNGARKKARRETAVEDAGCSQKEEFRDRFLDELLAEDDELSCAEETDFDEAPSDVEAALRVLRPVRRPHIVFQHLLYSVISNPNLVDREVQELARTGKLRLVQLPSGRDDIGIFSAEDWRAEIERLLEPTIAGSFAKLSLQVADLYVEGQRLDDADALCSAGLVRPRRDTPGNFYWFGCPSYGPYAKRIQHGRNAFRKALEASKFRELNVDKLQQSRPRQAALLALDHPSHDMHCPGGVNFLVHDLVGRHHATLDCRPAGRFVRLSI